MSANSSSVLIGGLMISLLLLGYFTIPKVSVPDEEDIPINPPGNEPELDDNENPTVQSGTLPDWYVTPGKMPSPSRTYPSLFNSETIARFVGMGWIYHPSPIDGFEPGPNVIANYEQLVGANMVCVGTFTGGVCTGKLYAAFYSKPENIPRRIVIPMKEFRLDGVLTRGTGGSRVWPIYPIRSISTPYETYEGAIVYGSWLINPDWATGMKPRNPLIYMFTWTIVRGAAPPGVSLGSYNSLWGYDAGGHFNWPNHAFSVFVDGKETLAANNCGSVAGEVGFIDGGAGVPVLCSFGISSTLSTGPHQIDIRWRPVEKTQHIGWVGDTASLLAAQGSTPQTRCAGYLIPGPYGTGHDWSTTPEYNECVKKESGSILGTAITVQLIYLPGKSTSLTINVKQTFTAEPKGFFATKLDNDVDMVVIRKDGSKYIVPEGEGWRTVNIDNVPVELLWNGIKSVNVGLARIGQFAFFVNSIPWVFYGAGERRIDTTLGLLHPVEDLTRRSNAINDIVTRETLMNCDVEKGILKFTRGGKDPLGACDLDAGFWSYGYMGTESAAKIGMHTGMLWRGRGPPEGMRHFLEIAGLSYQLYDKNANLVKTGRVNWGGMGAPMPDPPYVDVSRSGMPYRYKIVIETRIVSFEMKLPDPKGARESRERIERLSLGMNGLSLVPINNGPVTGLMLALTGEKPEDAWVYTATWKRVPVLKSPDGDLGSFEGLQLTGQVVLFDRSWSYTEFAFGIIPLILSIAFVVSRKRKN